jgi:hypothetical protein
VPSASLRRSLPRALALMTSKSQPFKRASPSGAFVCFLFRYDKYLDMAVEHGMALNLEAHDLRAAYEAGRFPSANWQEEARSTADESARELKQSMKSALKTTLVFAATGLIVAVLLGKVHPTNPVDWGKVLSVAGGVLAAWATLFELGGYAQTYSGEALHEVVHPLFFRFAFLPGLTLATIGQLWWQ